MLPAAVALALFVAVALWARQVSRERHEAWVEKEGRRFRARLSKPDWELYERHLGRPVPQALHELYSELATTDELGLELSDELYISSLAPLDDEGHRDSEFMAGADIIAIAWTGWGDPVHLLPGADTENEVYVTYHDGGDRVVVADDVDEFVANMRAAMKARQLPSAAAERPD